ncbi:flagellar hook-basal body protein [Alkalihalobacillus sp. CinArs1]|uniref:flagellar hook-basal body protein n=1 Tax=Alkalihalobacillus sp. CinArs1 TaxID=2995314 RepID=UPI0022DD576A|nr:flagellar hook-basal body protein [Alkalihalobacillus sp. CinArs1]
MNIGMYSASSSLSQTQKKMDTIANNIANVNTVGYKRREASFQNLLTQQYQNNTGEATEPGRLTPENLRVGYGAKIAMTNLRTDQGATNETGRNLDVMLEGENVYFRVQNGDNVHYTRDGAFQLQNTEDGRVNLVNSNGSNVLDKNGDPISFSSEPTNIVISDSGEISVEPTNETFQLSVATIDRPQSLLNEGGNEFRLREGEGEIVDTGFNVKQGFLEMSNVDLANETTEMITTQRLLQFQSRAMKMADEMMGLANTIKR